MNKPLIIILVILVIALLVTGGLWGYNKYLTESYPLKYSSYVEKYAKENNISEYLVYAVIKTESGFRTDARSNVGARGLMQIMEETFDWIKFKRGDTDTVYYDMYSAEKNIEYGCWLLGFLYEEFGDIDCVAAAYHAGRGNVNNWLSDRNYSSDGKHLDYIPISDTAHYVDKINATMDVYVSLYAGK
ncbi:MAG: lytic transglycosylase domain-containing protein [Oscillospiraceae bacterium]|nr:lytic transglycosylase domain-containing protein [Oscillospiraceae bacterium]